MWGHEPRSTGHLQELEKARKWILLQNHQKKYSPADPVIWAQRDPCKLLITRTVVHLHCFKPLHVCWSVTAVIGNEYNMPCTLKLLLPHDIFKEGTEQGARARFPHNWNQSKPHTRKIYAWDEKLTLDFSHGECLSKTYLVFCFCFILEEYTEMLIFNFFLMTVKQAVANDSNSSHEGLSRQQCREKGAGTGCPLHSRTTHASLIVAPRESPIPMDSGACQLTNLGAPASPPVWTWVGIHP